MKVVLIVKFHSKSNFTTALDDSVQLKLLTSHIWETYSKEYPNWGIHINHLFKYQSITIMVLTALKGFAQENLTKSSTPILTPWKPRSGPSDKEFLMGIQPHKREACKMKLPTEGISCPIVNPPTSWRTHGCHKPLSRVIFLVTT